jgi:hypothetical protein
MQPYMNYTMQKMHYMYLLSENPEKLRALRNQHKNKRVFIIGNGPSLNVHDLEKISGEIAFGTNYIYKLFPKTSWRPKYYIAIDPNFLRISHNDIPFSQFEMVFTGCPRMGGVQYSTAVNEVKIFQHSKFIVNKYCDLSAKISEDVSIKFSIGYTVTFDAIQLAIYMGFTEIILLGVDFSYNSYRDLKGRVITIDNTNENHFYKDKTKPKKTDVPYHYPCLHAYEEARKYADSHGKKILNATRGGKLEVFPRVDLDEVIKNQSYQTERSAI